MARDPFEQARDAQGRPARPAPPPGSWCSSRRSRARGREPHRPCSTGTSGSTGRRPARRRRPAPQTARAPPGSPGPRGTRAASATGAAPVARPPSRRPPGSPRHDAPTDSPSSLRSSTPARAARMPGPKSTFVVPRPRISPGVRLGQQVDPAVDAATGRERLEPEAVVGTRHDWIGELQDALEHLRPARGTANVPRRRG